MTHIMSHISTHIFGAKCAKVSFERSLAPARPLSMAQSCGSDSDESVVLLGARRDERRWVGATLEDFKPGRNKGGRVKQYYLEDGGLFHVRRYTPDVLAALATRDDTQSPGYIDWSIVKCRMPGCGAQLSTAKGTALRNPFSHVKRRHGDVWRAFHVQRSDQKEPHTGSSLQPPVNAALQRKDAQAKGPWSKEYWRVAQQLTARMLAALNLPMSMVEQPEWRERDAFYSQGEASVVCSKTMRNTMLELSKEVRDAIKAQLQLAPGVTLLSDGWSGCNKTGYFAVLASVITDDFRRAIFLLGLYELPTSHTADKLENYLTHAATMYGLVPSKICSVVGDSAAVQKKAMRDFMQKTCDQRDSSAPCFAHLLQLAVKAPLGLGASVDKCRVQLRSLRCLLSSCSKIASYFNSSNKATSVLKTRVWEKVGPHAPSILVMACSTRWDSYSTMLDRMVLLKVHVNYALTFLKGTTTKPDRSVLEAMLYFSKHEDTAVQLSQLLNQFRVYSKQAQTTCINNSAMMYVITMMVKEKTLDRQSTPASIRFYLSAVQDALSRLVPLSDSVYLPPALVASFLNVTRAYALLRYFGSGSDTVLKKAEEETEMVALRLLSRDDVRPASCDVPPAKRVRTSNAGTSFMMSGIPAIETARLVAHDIVENEDITIAVRKEMAVYKTMMISNQGKACDEFWCENRVQLPLLAKVAQHSFAHMSSSADAERAFSCAGAILTTKRNRMESDLLDALVLMRWNKPQLADVIGSKLLAMAAYATGDSVLRDCTGGATGTDTSAELDADWRRIGEAPLEEEHRLEDDPGVPDDEYADSVLETDADSP